MKIYTLTLNPAYDVHAETSSLDICHENFASIISRDAGGKGVNISRALNAAGVSNTAIVVLGKDNGEEFKNDLFRFGLRTVFLEKEGRIRENLTIHHGGDETRISFSGFSLDDSLLDEVRACMNFDVGTVVTFTGSIPIGVSKEAAKAFLIKLRECDVKIVLDCRSFNLRDICDIKPWLIKPNQQEVSEWFGVAVTTLEQAKACADKLHFMGVENAMVSMGVQGAVLVCDGVYTAMPPRVDPVSTVGAGDSSIAGFLCAAAEGLGSIDCLCRAVAFGTAACLTEGTQPPRKAQIMQIMGEIISSGGN